MFGFVLGLACLAGLASLRHERHWHRHQCGFGHDFGGRSSSGGRASLLNMLLEKLAASPGQEKTIRTAVREVVEELGAARTELRESRREVAAAIRMETFDAAAFQEILRQKQHIITRLGETVAAALGRVHETLDPHQLSVLAELVEAGSFERSFGFARRRHVL